MKGVIKMTNDMITLFNQLTSSELADYTLFDNILEYHFEKFRYLYFLINKINLKKINKIYCNETKDYITVYIEPHDNKYISEMVSDIRKKEHLYCNSDYFFINIIEEKNLLVIDVGMAEDREECDIYENRLI